MVTVKVYSTPTCPQCHRLKDFLKENNVKFEDINVSEDPEAAEEMIKKSGQMSVPVMDIGGELVIGYDAKKTKELLNLK